MAHHRVATEQVGYKSEAFRLPTAVMKNQLRNNVPLLSESLQIQVKESVALELGLSSNGIIHERCQVV